MSVQRQLSRSTTLSASRLSQRGVGQAAARQRGLGLVAQLDGMARAPRRGRARVT